MSAPIEIRAGGGAAEVTLIALLGGLVLAMLYLAVQLEKTRRVIEPIATSPIVAALTRPAART